MKAHLTLTYLFSFFKIATELLKRGAQVNAIDRYGHSGLHRAASKGNLKIVNILLDEFNASVDIADSEGNTPL